MLLSTHSGGSGTPGAVALYEATMTEQEHLVRRIDKCEQAASWAVMDLIDAKNTRWKGNFPGYAGYRQKGRADARAAKRRRARAFRRAGKLLCELA